MGGLGYLSISGLVVLKFAENLGTWGKAQSLPLLQRNAGYSNSYTYGCRFPVKLPWLDQVHHRPIDVLIVRELREIFRA
jgi:hypothetical protein